MTTEVRLTATTPDGQVVYVLADASGRLKLEEPIPVEGPPGPKGEDGKDGAPGKDGDPFTGQFSGDVTFNGDLDIDGTITATGSAVFQNSLVADLDDYGSALVVRQDEVTKAFIQSDGTMTALGAVTFTSKSVGFNANGELIFYSRNERYRAVAQSGNVMCEPYTREMELREKAEAWAEKNKKPDIKPIQD